MSWITMNPNQSNRCVERLSFGLRQRHRHGVHMWKQLLPAALTVQLAEPGGVKQQQGTGSYPSLLVQLNCTKHLQHNSLYRTMFDLFKNMFRDKTRWFLHCTVVNSPPGGEMRKSQSDGFMMIHGRNLISGSFRLFFGRKSALWSELCVSFAGTCILEYLWACRCQIFLNGTFWSMQRLCHEIDSLSNRLWRCWCWICTKRGDFGAEPKDMDNESHTPVTWYEVLGDLAPRCEITNF